ncbi:immunoglobulin superfamily member 1-like [Gallus gallus]|uniref:immunoglobulin superfamily member 1-like n=1 Tax=Gallus gallus TaxID=9031 RepID=UPI001AE76ABA|nr:immunoglobulin superfamily member 1-like [Gallus gallus]
MDKRQDMAEFFLVHLKQEDAVQYWCRYDTVAPWGTSNKSDPVQLVYGEGTGESRWAWAVPARWCPIAVSSVNSDSSYPPPAISLKPEECVDVGMNVTIQCWNQEHGGTIFLHKDGHSAPIQHQDPDDGGTATFTLFGVNTDDSGTYRRSYRIGGSYLLFSPLGDNVTLEVIPRPAPPGDGGGPSRNLVAAVAGGCAAAIVIIIVLTVSFLLVAQRRRMQTDERPGTTPRSPEAVQIQVSPGDSEGLTYAQLQVVTSSTHPPASSTTPEPPIIYAEVGTRGPR